MLWDRRELTWWPGFLPEMVFVADELSGWVSLDGAVVKQSRLLLRLGLPQWLKSFSAESYMMSWSQQVLG